MKLQDENIMTYKSVHNSFSYYQHIIDNLLHINRIKIVPLYELQEQSAENIRLIGLRHDIDSNPEMALKAAKYLARKGVCGSFYVLHTASYYGEFKNNTFIRNSKLAEWILGFIVAGCEIGLHNDALGVFSVHNRDGLEHFKQELEWLRSLGAVIHGTVGHNSAPIYGAENFEIFKERVLWYREARTPSGQILPLGKLSEKKLNLKYEGNFPIPKNKFNIGDAVEFCAFSKDSNIRSKSWMRRYLFLNPCFDRKIDYQFWLIGNDKWVAGGKFNDENFFEWEIDSNRLFDLIKKLPKNSRSIIVIHPDYFEFETLKRRKDGRFGVATVQAYNLRYQSIISIIISKIYRKLKFYFNHVYLRCYNFLPYETRWRKAQCLYLKWSKNRLPVSYLQQIRKTGKNFSVFVGKPQLCLDIGCGNGLIGGMTYEEAGYIYLNPSETDTVIGIDPLSLNGPKPPWVKEYVMAICEKLPFRITFDKITIATSIDHFQDPILCLEECASVLKHGLFIWTTCLKKAEGDLYHPIRFTKQNLLKILSNSGYSIINCHFFNKSIYGEEVFIEARKKNL